jgi:hypothetical protein
MRNDEINMIRDIALDLEHDNPSLAIKLLEIAHAYRPNGAFILNKLIGLKHSKHLLHGGSTLDQGHTKKFCELPDRSAVLKIKPAGTGDMISQCSRFFSFCSIIAREPYFSLPTHSSNRNGITYRALFEMLGFYDAGLIVSNLNLHEPVPLSTAATHTMLSKQLNSRVFEYDNASIGASSPLSVMLGQDQDISQLDAPLRSMTSTLKQSDLYRAICNKRDSNKASGQKIALHVRLGDVAQIQSDVISHLLSEPDSKPKLLHARGIFEQDTIQSKIPYSNLKRYKPISSYEKALEGVLSTDEDAHVTLLSDGMTRVAKYLIEEHNAIFKNPRISQWQLEQELSVCLKPLIERSDKCIIGEGGELLIDTLIEGLSSDVIISGSPALFQPLSNMMGLNTTFVYV